MILISNELDELPELSDGVIVLYRGQIAYDSPIENLSMDEHGLCDGGNRLRCLSPRRRRTRPETSTAARRAPDPVGAPSAAASARRPDAPRPRRDI